MNGNRDKTGSDTGTAALGLKSVLTGSLPAELLTGDAPDRYTVEAVFTRRPEQVEIDAIGGDGAHRFLFERGYPEIQLTVSDRRLRIDNTSLEQLRDGLASVLAEYLALTGSAARMEEQAAIALSRVVAEREHERAEAVRALAESVNFSLPPGIVPVPDDGNGEGIELKKDELNE